MANVAERAAAGALVAHNHEGCSAITKAFANVRAASFFADSEQIVLAKNLFDLSESGIDCWRLDPNPVRFLQHFSRWHDLDWDA